MINDTMVKGRIENGHTKKKWKKKTAVTNEDANEDDFRKQRKDLSNRQKEKKKKKRKIYKRRKECVQKQLNVNDMKETTLSTSGVEGGGLRDQRDRRSEDENEDSLEVLVGYRKVPGGTSRRE